MGGTIEVSSVEGKGTTFTFLLNLQKAPAGNPTAGEIPAVGCAVLLGMHELETLRVRRAFCLSDEQIAACRTVEELAGRVSTRPNFFRNGPAVVIIACTDADDFAKQIEQVSPCCPKTGIRFIGAVFGHEAVSEAPPGA